MDRVILRVRTGRQAYERAVLSPGQTVSVGRTSLSDFVVGFDERLSNKHFSVQWSGVTCRLIDDHSLFGTNVNGEPADEVELHNGDWIRAGDTDFSLYFEGHTPPPASDPVPPPPQARVIDGLHRDGGTIFAVLDAARDERILTLLREAVDLHRLLLEGPKGRAVEEQGPYLVVLEPGSSLLKRLLIEGWGKRWGIYGAGRPSFAELRTHARRFLMVDDEETGEKMYFRFYDPAVLRVFLRAASRRQRELFFGAVHCFFAEDERGEGLRLSRDGSITALTD